MPGATRETSCANAGMATTKNTNVMTRCRIVAPSLVIVLPHRWLPPSNVSANHRTNCKCVQCAMSTCSDDILRDTHLGILLWAEAAKSSVGEGECPNPRRGRSLLKTPEGHGTIRAC